MMYYPDVWVFVEIKPDNTEDNPDKETVYKVLAGWYGGFASANTWKINSGIKEIIDHNDYYEVIGYSGSTYKCSKYNEKLSSLTASIYTHIQTVLKDDDYLVNIVTYNQIDNKIITKRRRYD